MDLISKHCVPCEGGVPALTAEEIGQYIAHTPEWEVTDEDVAKIVRTFKFKDFKQAMIFVNAIAALAEEENHHPNIAIAYSKVTLTLWTHAIDGLSDNDFILAAKIDRLPGA